MPSRRSTLCSTEASTRFSFDSPPSLHPPLTALCPCQSRRVCCDWQVHLSVSQVSVSLSVDCQRVGERPARPLGALPTDGFQMLGKLVNTRGPRSGSVPVHTLTPTHTHTHTQTHTQTHTSTHTDMVNPTVCVFQLQLQSFEIVCNNTWSSEDTCCDLPALVSTQNIFSFFPPQIPTFLHFSSHTQHHWKLFFLNIFQLF